MTKKEITRIVQVTFIISILCMVIFEVVNIDLLSFGGLKSAFSFSTIVTLWWGYYFKFGWRHKLIKFILYKENINGTWFGEYKSVGPKNEEYTGYISVVIKQSYLNMHIDSYTDKNKTYSYDEKLIYNDKSRKTNLIYVYSQEELNVLDPGIRKGISELELIKDKERYTLYGKFWTNSRTLGELKLKKISTEHIEHFNEAQQRFKEEEK